MAIKPRREMTKLEVSNPLRNVCHSRLHVSVINTIISFSYRREISKAFIMQSPELQNNCNDLSTKSDIFPGK